MYMMGKRLALAIASNTYLISMTERSHHFSMQIKLSSCLSMIGLAAPPPHPLTTALTADWQHAVMINNSYCGSSSLPLIWLEETNQRTVSTFTDWRGSHVDAFNPALAYADAWKYFFYRSAACLPATNLTTRGSASFSAWAAELKFCRNSSWVGNSPSTMSVTTLTHTRGTPARCATQATPEPSMSFTEASEQ